jgi:hypothetical protein
LSPFELEWSIKRHSNCRNLAEAVDKYYGVDRSLFHLGAAVDVIVESALALLVKPVHARLHVLLARQSPVVGLVIRHGTAKSVCTLLWNRKTDKFTLGQWMRGRIDTESCDLSPDGGHFLYTAAKYGLFKPSKYVDPVGQSVAWTVVSRTPYLKAVAYYPQRHAGGWFLDQHEYCVPAGSPDPDDRESPEVRRVVADSPKPSLYGARLLRDGWAMDDLRAQFARRIDYVKPAGAGWELRHSPQRGYSLSFGQVEADTNGWEWADIDGERLVWAMNGCLWAGHMRRNGIHRITLLHDFNGMSFERLAAPYEGGRPVTQEPVTKGTFPAAARSPIGKRPHALRRKPNRKKIRPGVETDD